ncbi:hypothetical protein [Cryobacterium sp.]|uniref:hypothetical protein n=1 Tax=Cryobacterium sp. TaxID=1926290 RepID=UPI00262D0303|nr:hypothetical protein [Cryobacterium sp.]
MTTTAQHALSSGFTARSTATEVLAGIDLTGRTAIVTGGYSGLGIETVAALAGAGAQVIVPARRPEAAWSRWRSRPSTWPIWSVCAPSPSTSWPPGAASTS